MLYCTFLPSLLPSHDNACYLCHLWPSCSSWYKNFVTLHFFLCFLSYHFPLIIWDRLMFSFIASYPFCLLTLIGSPLLVLIGHLYLPLLKNSTGYCLYLLAWLCHSRPEGSLTTHYLHHQGSQILLPPSQSSLNTVTLHSMSHLWCQGNCMQTQCVEEHLGPWMTETRSSDSDPGHNASALGRLSPPGSKDNKCPTDPPKDNIEAVQLHHCRSQWPLWGCEGLTFDLFLSSTRSAILRWVHGECQGHSAPLTNPCWSTWLTAQVGCPSRMILQVERTGVSTPLLTF